MYKRVEANTIRGGNRDERKSNSCEREVSEIEGKMSRRSTDDAENFCGDALRCSRPVQLTGGRTCSAT